MRMMRICEYMFWLWFVVVNGVRMWASLYRSVSVSCAGEFILIVNAICRILQNFPTEY